MSDDLDLLLVRPASPGGGFTRPLPIGATTAYVLVNLGAAAADAPLARCELRYLGRGRVRVTVTQQPAGPDQARLGARLLSGIADGMRAVGVRRLEGTGADGTPLDLRL